MEKDVDEVKKTAHYLKTKIEELDKEVTLLNAINGLIQPIDSWCKSTHSILYCRIWQTGRSLGVEKDQVLTGQEQRQPCQ